MPEFEKRVDDWRRGLLASGVLLGEVYFANARQWLENRASVASVLPVETR